MCRICIGLWWNIWNILGLENVLDLSILLVVKMSINIINVEMKKISNWSQIVFKKKIIRKTSMVTILGEDTIPIELRHGLIVYLSSCLLESHNVTRQKV